MRFGPVLAGLAVVASLTAAWPADVQERHACSPTVTLEGFSDALDMKTYRGEFVGNLSALAVDRDGSLAALSDRSFLFRLDRRTLTPTSVVPLADESGARLDSEGLAVDRDGSRLITSEIEPSVRRYDPDGRLLGRLPVPDMLWAAPAGRARPNGTFEGLTLLPDGHTLLASMEYPLTGDPADTVRFQTWERRADSFSLAAQYAYRTDPGLGVAEVQGIGHGRLLVLERAFTTGVGDTVRLYLAGLRHATDVSGIAWLTGRPGVRPVGKTLLADIASCPSLGATAKQPQPNPVLDNIEGMAVTGRDHGTLRVTLVSDDNQNAAQTTRFYFLRLRIG
ncbi:esterase-like activity of phytase family protein [Streptomyces sp. NPDC049915]|uniref:esterase-like activity of phytase family protein n=1 Tax=Streptomyces sp. NPDC049915 TaxID=3155510 RepID=UPI0034374ED4